MNKTLIASLSVVAALLAPATVRADGTAAGPGHPVAFVKNSVITARVKARLAADPWRSMAEVGADTDLDGVVVLSGAVKDRSTADRAVATARETEGVVSVVDHIRIRKEE